MAFETNLDALFPTVNKTTKVSLKEIVFVFLVFFFYFSSLSTFVCENCKTKIQSFIRWRNLVRKMLIAVRAKVNRALIIKYFLSFFLVFYLNHKTDFSWHSDACTLNILHCLLCQRRVLATLATPPTRNVPTQSLHVFLSLSLSRSLHLSPSLSLFVWLSICFYCALLSCSCRLRRRRLKFISLNSNEAISKWIYIYVYVYVYVYMDVYALLSQPKMQFASINNSSSGWKAAKLTLQSLKPSGLQTHWIK